MLSNATERERERENISIPVVHSFCCFYYWGHLGVVMVLFISAIVFHSFTKPWMSISSPRRQQSCMFEMSPCISRKLESNDEFFIKLVKKSNNKPLIAVWFVVPMKDLEHAGRRPSRTESGHHWYRSVDAWLVFTCLLGTESRVTWPVSFPELVVGHSHQQLYEQWPLNVDPGSNLNVKMLS